MDNCDCTAEDFNKNLDVPALTIKPDVLLTSKCPACGSEGKRVPARTVKSMLSVSLRNVLGDDYRFCTTDTCDVAYFSANGQSLFTKSQVREKIYQKETNIEDVFVCYCFRHTRGEINKASIEAQAEILAEINAGVQAGQCACDIRNPQGSCCLGNVHKLIKQTKKPEK